MCLKKEKTIDADKPDWRQKTRLNQTARQTLTQFVIEIGIIPIGIDPICRIDYTIFNRGKQFLVAHQNGERR